MSLSERIRPALEIRAQSLEQSAVLPKDSTLPRNVMEVPRASGLLSESELELTEKYDATALVKMLAEGVVTSEALLLAFRKRATIAQQCTNCLTELIPQAINDARACDEFLAKTGRPIGPLHGLPVSVKEQISIAGRRTNVGFVAMVDNITSEDAQVVTSLKRLGAVVFARTNQPQSLMQLQTDNNIYGATVNPRNTSLTAGGSTGGEAALMAMHGTPLGIGGDIGGSICVPAALNGIYGFYPSVGRISGEGALVPLPGNDSIPGTLGPFTRSLRDISLFCTAYSLTNPWLDDPSLLPMPILSPSPTLSPTNPLRIGILTSDNVVTPLPPIQQALKQVQARLQQAPNITLVPFQPYKHDYAWTLISANYFEDGGAAIKELCKTGSEPLLPATEWILAQCKESTVSLSLHTMQARKAARDAYRVAYSQHWNKAAIDVLIAPVTPGTAPRVDSKAPYWGYTAVWNLLQYPAIAFPVSRFSGGGGGGGGGGGDLLDYQPRNEKEAAIAGEYVAEEAEGMPVGLQIVARRLHESVLVEAARVIENVMKGGVGCRL